MDQIQIDELILNVACARLNLFHAAERGLIQSEDVQNVFELMERLVDLNSVLIESLQDFTQQVHAIADKLEEDET